MLGKTKYTLLFLFALAFAIAGFSLTQNKTAYADYTVSAGQKCQDNSDPAVTKSGGTQTYTCADSTKTSNGTTPAAGGTGTGTDSKTGDVTTCAVEKIGWAICPIMEQAAKISDKAFQLLADNFLRTDPELVSNQSGTKTAWEVSRNIANIMFIIAFLAVIVSQVTGMGINNYGLKKMIPRLLVGAIAVNVSYYLCQLAVDLTNILGYEIEEAMSQISNSIGPSVFGSASQLGAANYGNSFGNVMTTIIVAALAVAGIVWLIMGPMIAVVAMVLITALSIIVILLLRKALIVLLIVASPIAFVMYLLPNTEGLFTKWRKAFTSLLFVFPVVGVLFGAGQLASTIIIVSGATSQQQAEKAKGCQPDNSKDKQNFNSGQGGYSKPGSYDSCGMGSIVITGTKNNTASSTCKDGHGSDCHLAVNWLLGLTAMLVAVAPLIAVWSVLKGALAAAGSIGGKVTANIAKGGDGMIKRARIADENRRKSINANALEGGFGRRTAAWSQRRKLKADRRDARLQSAQDMFNANDGKAEGIAMDTRKSQLLSQAAKQKEAKDFTDMLAKGGMGNLAQYGQNAGALKDQVAAQQAKAVAETIKDAELKMSDQSISAIGTALEAAMTKGDTTQARAMQNLLLSRGSAGMQAFHTSVGNAAAAGTSSGMMQSLKDNITANHGDIRNSDASLGKWSEDASNASLSSHFANASGAWTGLTTAKFAGMAAHAQKQAASTMSAADKARIKADLNNSQTDKNKVSADAFNLL